MRCPSPAESRAFGSTSGVAPGGAVTGGEPPLRRCPQAAVRVYVAIVQKGNRISV
jgi:hypothetical protein